MTATKQASASKQHTVDQTLSALELIAEKRRKLEEAERELHEALSANLPTLVERVNQIDKERVSLINEIAVIDPDHDLVVGSKRPKAERWVLWEHFKSIPEYTAFTAKHPSKNDKTKGSSDEWFDRVYKPFRVAHGESFDSTKELTNAFDAHLKKHPIAG